MLSGGAQQCGKRSQPAPELHLGGTGVAARSLAREKHSFAAAAAAAARRGRSRGAQRGVHFRVLIWVRERDVWGAAIGRPCRWPGVRPCSVMFMCSLRTAKDVRHEADAATVCVCYSIRRPVVVQAGSFLREGGSDALFELYPTATGTFVDEYERLYVQDGRGLLYRLLQVPPEFVEQQAEGAVSSPTVLVLVGNLEDPSDPPVNAGMLFVVQEDGDVAPLEDAEGNQYGVSMAELNRIKRERSPTLGEERVPQLEEVLSSSQMMQIERDIAKLDADPDDADAEAAVVRDGEMAARAQLEAAGITS